MNFQSHQTVTALECCKVASSASQISASHTMAEAGVLRDDYRAACTGSGWTQVTSRMCLSGGILSWLIRETSSESNS